MAASYFPLWKRGIEGDFSRLIADNVCEALLVPPLARSGRALFQSGKECAKDSLVFRRSILNDVRFQFPAARARTR